MDWFLDSTFPLYLNTQSTFFSFIHTQSYQYFFLNLDLFYLEEQLGVQYLVQGYLGTHTVAVRGQTTKLPIRYLLSWFPLSDNI